MKNTTMTKLYNDDCSTVMQQLISEGEKRDLWQKDKYIN